MLAGICLQIQQRFSGNPRQEQLQVVDRRGLMRILLRNRLSLLGQTQIAPERLARKRLNKPIRRTCSSADRPPTSMKETDPHPVLLPDLHQLPLRTTKVHQTCQYPTILVAVAVANHHLPNGVAIPPLMLNRSHTSLRYGMPQKRIVNLRTVMQIVHRLEQGYHRQRTLQAIGGLSHQSNFSG